jgi:hypothetical protein
MKKKTINLKSLKGALTRDEMKTIKGGDVVFCTRCGEMDPNVCWAKYCQSENCWFMSDNTGTYVCQCQGDC